MPTIDGVPSTIYLATCAAIPHGEEGDGDRLLAACERQELLARWQVWDDPAVDWARADLVVIRSTWDYTTRRAQFLDWTSTLTRSANRHDVIVWNSDKRYLADLQAAGVPVVTTSWAGPGEAVEFPYEGEYVIKPSVGAGSRGAARFRGGPADEDRARRHVDALHAAGRTVMLQPYLSGVESAGETALVYLGGRYSHSIRKGPMLADGVVNAVDGPALWVEENITGREPSDAERMVADHVLSQAPPDLLYARVDLLPGVDGPVLVELELTEPSLFLGYADDAADRLAKAIRARVDE